MNERIAWYFMNVVLLAAVLASAAGTCQADAPSDVKNGFALLVANDLCDAVAAFKQAIGEDPTYVQAYQFLAWCYSKQNDSSDAIATAELGVTKAVLPRDARVLKDLQGLLIDLYISSRKASNAAKALPMVTAFVAQYPTELNWQVQLGRCYRALGRFSDAQAVLGQCITSAAVANDANNRKLARYELASACADSGDRGTAIGLMQAYIADYPNDGPAMPYALAMAYHANRNYSAAAQAYDYVTANFPDQDPYTMWSKCRKAEAMFQAGQQDDALAYLENLQANDNDPEVQAGALFYEAFLYTLENAAQQAITLLQQEISTYPKCFYTTEAAELLGMDMLSVNRVTDAQAWYLSLQSAEPASGRWDVALAYCLYHEGDWPDARNALTNICSKYSANGVLTESNYLLGMCCLKLGDTSAASAAFSSIMSGYPCDCWVSEAQLQLQAVNAQTSASKLAGTRVAKLPPGRLEKSPSASSRAVPAGSKTVVGGKAK